MEALRPLLRLAIRSEEFRTSILTALRVAKHVIEGNAEGSLENVLEKGEEEGLQEASKEAQKSIVRTGPFFLLPEMRILSLIFHCHVQFIL